MDLTIIFSKTPKATRAPLPWVGGLSASFKQVLSHVDGKHNVEQILPKCGKISSAEVYKILQKLEEEGYIKRTASHEAEPDWLNDASSYGISANNNYSIAVEEIDPSTLNFDDESFSVTEMPTQTAPDPTRTESSSAQKAETITAPASDLQFNVPHLLIEEAPEVHATQERDEPTIPPIDSNPADSTHKDQVPGDSVPAIKDSPEITGETPEQQSSEAAEQAKRIANVWAKAREKVELTAREQAEAAEKLKLQESFLQLDTAQKPQVEAAEKAHVAESAQVQTQPEQQAHAGQQAETAADDHVRLAQEKAAQEAADRERRAQEELAIKAQREAEVAAEAAAQAQAQVQAQEQAQAQAQAQLEAERIARTRAEELAKAKAEEVARLQAEAEHQAKAEAAEQARLERERMAQAEAAEKKLREEERQARLHRKAEQVAEKKAQEEADKKARKAAKLLAKEEKAAQARLKAEEKARAKALRNFNRPRLTHAKLFKPFLVSILMLPGLAIAFMHLVNLTLFIAPAERFASALLGEPVKVQEVRASLFPQPYLVLENVSIGSRQALTIGSVKIISGLSVLFSDRKSVESLELNTLEATPAVLARQAQWLVHAANSDKISVAHIQLKNVSLRVEDLAIDTFNGEVALTPAGGLKQVTLINAQGNLELTLTPAEMGASLALTASNWSPPLWSALNLDEVTAKGEVNQRRVRFSQIEAKAFGGSIRAQGDLNWSGNASTSGNFELIKMRLPRLLKAYNSPAAIDGALNVNAAFTGNAPSLSALPAQVEANANVEVHNGKIRGLALSNALVAGAASRPPADANFTRFDRLSTQLQISNGQYQFKACDLTTEQLTARGNVNVEANNAISGKISAELVSTSQRRQSNFILGGQVSDIVLK